MSSELRPRPTGWPVGSFDSYSDAQAAVDKLSDLQFPVKELTIVGVDLMEVERVSGRLTWPRVLAGGAVSGAWIGLFFGLLFTFLGEASSLPSAGHGVVFGVVSAAVPYALSAARLHLPHRDRRRAPTSLRPPRTGPATSSPARAWPPPPAGGGARHGRPIRRTASLTLARPGRCPRRLR